MAQTTWHPTEAAAVAEAKELEIQGYRLAKVRVDLGERGFPQYWWRAEDQRKPAVWTNEK